MDFKEKLAKFFRPVAKEYTRLDYTCNNCGREIFGGEKGRGLFCPDCYEHLTFNDKFICKRCGRSTTVPTDVCPDCAEFDAHFDMARSTFYYAPPVDGLIRKLKYDNRRYLAEVLALMMQDTLVKYFPDAEIVTWVPMSQKAQRERGYNQAQLIAEKLAALVGLPALPLAVKSRPTDNQVRLGREERQKNLVGSFTADRDVTEGRIVLLVDDVLTTGATADAMAVALKKAGAVKVYVLTAASVTDERTARALGQQLSSTRAEAVAEREALAKRMKRRREREKKKLEKQNKKKGT